MRSTSRTAAAPSSPLRLSLIHICKITREQIASILWRLAGKPVYSASLRSYTDYASVSDYAYDAMSWAVGSGYVKGSGAKLSPKNNATRAEVAVMLHRYLTK